jgi:hypothetical protein
MQFNTLPVHSLTLIITLYQLTLIHKLIGLQTDFFRYIDSQTFNMEEQKDPRLWKIAKRRAAFKQSLYVFIIINIMLWLIWWFTDGRKENNSSWPWPVWISIFWGIAILFQYVQAYSGGDKGSIAEDEYDKLKKKQDKQ